MSEQRCALCVWYHKPWPGPTHGYCYWLCSHDVELPEWLHEAARSRGPNAGENCKTFKPKRIEVGEKPIPWSARVKWTLRRKGLENPAQLCDTTEQELRSLPGLGKTSLAEIKRRLVERGLKLKGDIS